MLNPTAPGNAMFADAVRWRDGERILYGSAWPCCNLRQAVADMERFQFSEAHKAKIFYQHAEKLLGRRLC